LYCLRTKADDDSVEEDERCRASKDEIKQGALDQGKGGRDTLFPGITCRGMVQIEKQTERES